jgi:hypothetical protein
LNFLHRFWRGEGGGERGGEEEEELKYKISSKSVQWKLSSSMQTDKWT